MSTIELNPSIDNDTDIARAAHLAPRARLASRLAMAALVWLIAVGGLFFGATAAYAQDPPGPDRADDTATPAGDGDTAAPTGDGGTPASTEGADIDALRQEYLRLRDELFRSRARAASVGSAMYSTRLQIFLTYGSGRFQAVTRTTIRLDGANVYDDSSGAVASDAAPRFEGFVAPGRHVLSIRIETTSKDDERFTSIMENTFSIQAPGGKDVIVTAKAKDEGNLAYQWQKKESGSYQPSLSVSVKTTKRPGAKAAGKSAQSKTKTNTKPKTKTANTNTKDRAASRRVSRGGSNDR